MSSFEEKMAELRGRFLARAAEERVLLQAALEEMNKGELRRLAHGLSGSAGTFGFAPLSADAQAVEEAVDMGAPDPELQRLGSILLDRLANLQAV
jgi:HPt (histidine-containing phosphotransfer) domain-containing protein